MANLFNKIYTGALAKYEALATKDANALYMVNDEATGVKSMYRGTTKVAGDFIIVNGVEPTSPEKGVIYYISEFGKKEASEGQEAVDGKPYVGFWDGTKWVALSDQATIDTLDERITNLENATKIDGTATAGSIGEKVAQLDGADTVDGSVKKQIKDAVEALVYEDEETEGDVVVAVSQENGVIAVEKQTLAVTEQETPSEGMQKTYDVTIGEKSIGVIDIPFCDAVLENAVLGKMDSEVDEEDGTVTTPEGSTAHDALVMVFKKGDGTYVGVKVDIATILTEAEFKDGLAVSENGEVSIKLVDENPYLGFGDETTGNKSLVAKIGSFTEYDEDGSVKTEAVEGLANITAVEKVITDNEKVTAAALNDINVRIGNNDELQTEAKIVVDAINELKSSADVAVKTVKQATTTQEVTVSTSDDKTEVTIGVTKAAYTAATDDKKTNGEFTAEGLVDSALLKAYIADEIAQNAVYWETLD